MTGKNEADVASVKAEGSTSGVAAAAAAGATASNRASEQGKKRKANAGATGGVAVLPASSASVPSTAVPQDAKRARVGKSQQPAIGGMQVPIQSVPIATMYSGDITVLQAAPTGAGIPVVQIMPHSFQEQAKFNQQQLNTNAPSGGIQPQSVSVTQDSVTADVVMALCGMRDQNNTSFGWQDAQKVPYAGAGAAGGAEGAGTSAGGASGATAGNAGRIPKRTSNGRAGKRNLSTECVSVLRQWYDEHQDWPYPNDAEQADLAQRAAISTKMVNTWFINARKRRKQASKSQQAGLPPNGNRVKRKGGCGIVHNSAFAGVQGYEAALSHSSTAAAAAAAAAPGPAPQANVGAHPGALSGLIPVAVLPMPTPPFNSISVN